MCRPSVQQKERENIKIALFVKQSIAYILAIIYNNKTKIKKAMPYIIEQKIKYSAI